MHRAKLLGRAGWHAGLWAVAQLWPRERKGVCLRVLFKDINLCKTRGKIWVTLPEMVSTASCTFVGRGRREIQWVLLMVPEPQPPHPRDPFHSLSRPPATFRAPEPKKVLGHTALESVCLFQSHFSQLPFDTVALFSEIGEVSCNNSLIAIDHIFQTKSWNM